MEKKFEPEPRVIIGSIEEICPDYLKRKGEKPMRSRVGDEVICLNLKRWCGTEGLACDFLLNDVVEVTPDTDLGIIDNMRPGARPAFRVECPGVPSKCGPLSEIIKRQVFLE